MLCCLVVHVLILQTCKGNPQHLTCWLYLRHHSVLGLPGGCISSPSPSVCSAAAALGLSWACERAWQRSQRLWQGLSIRGATPSLSLHQNTFISIICIQGPLSMLQADHSVFMMLFSSQDCSSRS